MKSQHRALPDCSVMDMRTTSALHRDVFLLRLCEQIATAFLIWATLSPCAACCCGHARTKQCRSGSIAMVDPVMDCSGRCMLP